MSEQVIEGLKGMMEIAQHGTTQLMDEALRLYMVIAVLDILKFASVFVIFYIVKRFLDTVTASAESPKTKRLSQSAKLIALVLSIAFFVSSSFPGLVEVSKILVAPKLFLMQKGMSTAKEVKELTK